jgi:hypothetical protein
VSADRGTRVTAPHDTAGGRAARYVPAFHALHAVRLCPLWAFSIVLRTIVSVGASIERCLHINYRICTGLAAEGSAFCKGGIFTARMARAERNAGSQVPHRLLPQLEPAGDVVRAPCGASVHRPVYLCLGDAKSSLGGATSSLGEEEWSYQSDWQLMKHHRGDTPSWGRAPPLTHVPEGMRFLGWCARAPIVHPELLA